jgi:hypothetical protein
MRARAPHVSTRSVLCQRALARAAGRRKRLGGAKPEDAAAAVPNLKAIKRAHALCRQHVSPRDRVFVREPEWQHLDAGNVSIV